IHKGGFMPAKPRKKPPPQTTRDYLSALERAIRQLSYGQHLFTTFSPTTSLSCADQICTRRIAAFRAQGIHVKRDNRRSIAYSEELIFPMAATLQSTDRHHGIVGQEYCHLQRDSCIRPTEHPEPGGSHRAFQKQRTSTPPGD